MGSRRNQQTLHWWWSIRRSKPILRCRALPGWELAGSFARGQWHPLWFKQLGSVIIFLWQGFMNALVCTGSPFAARSSNKLKSFRAIKELGYVCCNAPLLLTTSSAEYGRLIPLYRGDAHQSLTCCTCSSNKASSARPAFEASGRSWNESAGKAVDTGGSTALRVEPDIRHAVVESGLRSCGVRFATFRDRLWRTTDRETVRNIATECGEVEGVNSGIRPLRAHRRTLQRRELVIVSSL